MEKPNFKATLNLPSTEMPLRASLATKEPELLAHWESIGLEDHFENRHQAASQKFVMHDGPPYPNGDIHLGHALNKVLKDIVVRFRAMSGYKSVFVPGWDCHGLPIEVQVIKAGQTEGEDNRKNIPVFRETCKKFALGYVDKQKDSFKRLGIHAQWDGPYLTMNPSYEAAVIRLFGKMAENGLIYQGRKPIHWCMHCETALAEAEIDYKDHKSSSVYVRFPLAKASEAVVNLGVTQADFFVWTTTPWTLPANVALAVNPGFEYIVFNHHGSLGIVAKGRFEALMQKFQWEDASEVTTLLGKDLMGVKAKHPFLDREVPLVSALFVTKDDGTGIVHIAPGHGQEDYVVGLEYNLPVIMPVNSKGRFTDEVKWQGIAVFDANKLICQDMESNGSLIKSEWVKHSYPHCWRCKNPVIFRATEQWFVGLDRPFGQEMKTLRQRALEAIEGVQWFPGWGQKRLTAMMENRPDWCISRQRFWGIPIPVFYCLACGHPEMAGVFNESVAKAVQDAGTITWFSQTPEALLPGDVACTSCGGKHFKKETDILDVWFESGASFAGVCELVSDLDFPASLYLEGSDQHRGWFQSSLLISLATRQVAPFKAVLTHGFLVDEKGLKMSKSQGNALSPQGIVEKMGADVLRWWVLGSDFKNDISISSQLLDQVRDSFSKVRNTLRFLLGNLSDFDAEKAVPFDQLREIDRWVLVKLNALVGQVTEAYTAYDFHLVSHRIHDFCTSTLSALYLDMVKDRLYCGQKNSLERRSTQTALHHLFDRLVRLLAPVMVFSAEEAYSYFSKPDKKASVHLESFPVPDPALDLPDLDKKWEKLLSLREKATQKLEVLRKNKDIGSSLEGKIVLTLSEPIDFSDWESLLIVSQVVVGEGPEDELSAYKAIGQKCERCWKVLPVSEGLCQRCHEIVFEEVTHG